MGQSMTCCEAFLHAQQSGTDNEEYSAAVKGDLATGLQIGHHELPYISFCPWCGADKRVGHPVEVAARKVVAARYYSGDDGWDVLKNAICELEGLVGRPKE